MTATTQPNQRSSNSPKRLLAISLLVALLFSFLGYVGYRWMRSDALATLIEFSGQPERDTARTLEQWQTAKSGDDFDEGDGARTPEASRAQFRLLGGAKLQLQPESTIRFQRSQSNAKLRVDVEVGQAEVRSGAGAITIDSEFGQLVLDANSSVSMSRDGDRLTVAVEVGGLQLSDRAVDAGSSVQLEIGGIVVDVPEDDQGANSEGADPGTEPEEVDLTPELEIGDGISEADLVVGAGDSFVVHDPTPPSAIGFNLSTACDGPARLTSGAQKTEAASQANLRFPPGQHAYEVRCLDKPEVVAARGSLRVLPDAGTKKLPTFTPTASVATDGRRYTVLYQHRLPNVSVSWPTAPQAESYTLKIGERSIPTKSPSYTFSSLPRGRHSVVFSAASTPARQSRTTTIEVVYDTQAPAARVADPPVGFEPADQVPISGQALPGWSVSVAGKKLEVDGQNKFSAQVEARGTIPISFSHPTLGTHYYLRRPKASP